MSKYAKIENGQVTNICVADAGFAEKEGLVLADDNAEIGGTYDGLVFTRKPQPEQPEPTQAERIAAALAGTEDQATIARKVEDLINHIVNGAALDTTVEAWRADRASKRSAARTQ